MLFISRPDASPTNHYLVPPEGKPAAAPLDQEDDLFAVPSPAKTKKKKETKKVEVSVEQRLTRLREATGRGKETKADSGGDNFLWNLSRL